jgi:hypothetical protein
MHARFNQSAVAETGRGIRGTFYPSSDSLGQRSIGPAAGKVVAILVAMAVVRTIVSHGGRHGGESRWNRRRGMIADLHRELHAEEASQAEAPAKG